MDRHQVLGSVLLVDDEEAICRVGARMLERAGYEALTAGDGREAVELLRKNVDRVVCAVVDLLMPEMDGEQTLRELRAIRDDLPVVVSSGYSKDAIADRSFADSVGYLAKPFRYQQLTDELSSAIAEQTVR